MKVFAFFILALALAAPAFGKTFDRCSLAREMSRLGVPRDQLARWTCIAEHESSYRTDVVGPPNSDGSNDYGIFQINNLYWCQPANGHFSYNQCHIGCNALLTDDIETSVRCAQEVLRMQGWPAWSTWKYCNGVLPSIDPCFQTEYEFEFVLLINMKVFAFFILALALAAPAFGKTFDRCSLAREMSRLGVPRDQLARWTCIAEHESSYRTNVVGPPNSDGSNDYGIFQINSLYWCQPPNGRFSYNQCHIGCNALLSDDIETSVRCAQKVLQMQGWPAWSTWKYCNGWLPNIDPCF
ncbi:uncharacterized protein LOC105211205 [Zeugodacus cucurbitae]|uniref:uncharacterized protein LOC105211205 n=1 Tax=Zeugodacus cucurbitae TaxID=28588 RepID=UPI0023D937DB|nr:uncharacterized protein LOC105211205 [Zeugodacus cucurbitae]